MGAATRFGAGATAFDTNPEAADAGRDAAALFAANGDGASSCLVGGGMVDSRAMVFNGDEALELDILEVGALLCETRLNGASFVCSRKLSRSAGFLLLPFITGVGLGRGGRSAAENGRGVTSGGLNGNSRLGGGTSP